jgi:hypothetical protein
MKRGKLLIFVGILVLLIVPLISAGVLSDFWNDFKEKIGKITGYAEFGEASVNITIGNNPPTIDWVETIDPIGPVDDATRSITFNFTATDPDGYLNINVSTAEARFQLTDEATRSNLSCVNWSQSGDDVNFTCTIDMWYFDKADTGWNINVTIKDINDAPDENSSTNFSYTKFTGMKMSPTSLEWDPIGLAVANEGANNDAIVINNTGNDEPININVTAKNLQGEETTDEYIYANNFTVENASEGCSGLATTMSNATSLNITSAILYRGNHSLNHNNATSGQEETYYCLKGVPQDISPQSYSSAAYGAWTITVIPSS